MRRHHRPRITVTPNLRQSPLPKLWILGLLSIDEVWQCGYCPMDKGFEKPRLLAPFGLNKVEVRRRRSVPPVIEERFYQLLDKVRYEQDEVFRNIRRLAARLNLTEAEQRILTFVIHCKNDALLQETAELANFTSRKVIASVLARLLDQSARNVEKALHAESTLRSSGMLEINFHDYAGSINDRLEVDNELLELSLEPDNSEAELMKLFFKLASPSSLSLDDFAHVKDDIEILLPLLRNASIRQRSGVNVLIHGVPGTGKTELARLLCDSLGMNLAVVRSTHANGDQIEPHRRIEKLDGCQKALSYSSDNLVLFDEAEDLLCDASLGLLGLFQIKRNSKASLTSLLEENRVPVIWLSNSVHMDPALLRRFTYILRLDIPGQCHRERILHKYTRDLPVSEAWRARAAAIPAISPSLVANAADLAQQIDAPEAQVEAVITRTLSNHLDAIGVYERLGSNQLAPIRWRSDVINADEDMAALLEELDPESGARFCLCGPPGTGKTAWAHQLARQLQRPLLVKQASDLLSPYIGMTEQNIAEAFREAERDRAILLIDEADSFLDSREHAEKRWEISQTNQFLSAMERFDGVLIATTNFMDRMDAAAMRRFDFKIRFDYMTPVAVRQMFTELCQVSGVAFKESPSQEALLQGLDKLTPGDFAAVARRLRVRKATPSAIELAELLRQEIGYKQIKNRPIGFNANLH